MLVHIITPCTRPHNLNRIEGSIYRTKPPDVVVDWIVVFDSDRIPEGAPQCQANFYHISKDGIGDMGNPQRNYGLDIVDPNADGYVVFLDDDNILHPNFFYTLVAAYSRFPDHAFQFNQVFPNGQQRLIVSPHGPLPGHCDTAQFAIPRKMIGDHRWDMYGYMADGNFFSTIYTENQDKFAMIPVDCTYYNFLRSENDL